MCRTCRVSLVPDLAKPVPQLSGVASRGVPFKAMGLVGLCLVGTLVWWSGAIPGAGDAPELASAAVVSRSASPEAQPMQVDAAVTLSDTPTPSPDGTLAAAQPTARSAQEKAASEEARVKRQAAAQARREQASRDRGAAEEQARMVKAREQQLVDEAARQQAAAEAAQQARAAQTTPPPPVVKTVEQTCASGGNFFSREACRLRSCADAAFVKDPVCVRFRETEAANRRAVTN